MTRLTGANLDQHEAGFDCGGQGSMLHHGTIQASDSARLRILGCDPPENPARPWRRVPVLRARTIFLFCVAALLGVMAGFAANRSTAPVEHPAPTVLSQILLSTPAFDISSPISTRASTTGLTAKGYATRMAGSSALARSAHENRGPTSHTREAPTAPGAPAAANTYSPPRTAQRPPSPTTGNGAGAASTGAKSPTAGRNPAKPPGPMNSLMGEGDS